MESADKLFMIFKILRAIKERRFLYSIRHRLIYNYDIDPVYYYSIFFNKPYLGKLYYTNQLGDERKIHFEKVLNIVKNKNEDNEGLNLLEIGAWGGASTLYWAKKLSEINLNSKIITIDLWDTYEEISNDYSKHHNRQKMKDANKDDKMYKIFLHNLKSSKLKNISFIRGKSQDVMKLLNDQSFDIIYIDGDHSYNGCKNDILQAKRLIKNNGIICGDDLEKQYFEIDKRYTDKNSKDYINHKTLDYSLIDKDNNGSGYLTETHLGVSAAVNEEFGKVEMYDGFWFKEIKSN